MLCSFSAPGADIGESVRSGSLWKQSLVEMAKIALKDTRCERVEEGTLRFPAGELQLGGLNTGECLLEMEEGQCTSLRVMVYNRGDDGELAEKDFDAVVADTQKKISELTGVRPRVHRMSKRKTAVKVQSMEWQWENGIIRMESSGGKRRGQFVAEFVRLTLGADAKAIERGGAESAVRKNELRGNIVREEDGTVWLRNIPMVDQGQKGYCVPATLARVFAFYGMEGVDQHALAALCESASGEGGTSSLDMETAMRTICRKFRVKFTVLENFQQCLEGTIGEYNKLARREDRPAMPYSGMAFEMANPQLLLQARAGKKTDVTKWLKPIRKSIDSGTPVIWMVMVGIYPEPMRLPQTRGGHARLIIGYNARKQTIIYSDSWGERHARKELPAAEACAMTVGRYIAKLK